MPEVTGKRCSVCGEVLPLEEFHRSSKARDGRQAQCKACTRKSNAAWNAANRERARATDKAWAAANQDRVRELNAAYEAANVDKRRRQHAEWYVANKDRHRAINKVWRTANPDRVQALNAAFLAANPGYGAAASAKWAAAHPGEVLAGRAKQRGTSVVEVFTLDELIVHLLDRGIDPGVCLYCKIAPMKEWDHVMPIALGGPHVITNLAPACKACNKRKGKSLPDPAIVALLQGPPQPTSSGEAAPNA